MTRPFAALLIPPLMLTASLAMAESLDDFSARLDKLWNFGKVEESQARFRAELGKYPKDSREALEVGTQIARSQGLARKYGDADKTLDAIAPRLDAVPARVKVRYLLERGRTRNSSGDKAAAVPLFLEAIEAGRRDTLPGADFYRVDALHMLGIAAPASEQLDWNLKALAAASASSDERARGWAASLHNNIGWTYFDRGDYTTALEHWQKALPLREASGNALNVRIARWTVARGLRATGRLDDAKAIQVALAAETEAANDPDGYVYEELAEIAAAQGDRAAAKSWATKAHALLKDDPGMPQERVKRLAAYAEGEAP
ncbi:MAG: tetratricopeptide repeat protein [Burkholderiales bacterium]